MRLCRTRQHILTRTRTWQQCRMMWQPCRSPSGRRSDAHSFLHRTSPSLLVCCCICGTAFCLQLHLVVGAALSGTPLSTAALWYPCTLAVACCCCLDAGSCYPRSACSHVKYLGCLNAAQIPRSARSWFGSCCAQHHMWRARSYFPPLFPSVPSCNCSRSAPTERDETHALPINHAATCLTSPEEQCA